MSTSSTPPEGPPRPRGAPTAVGPPPDVPAAGSAPEGGAPSPTTVQDTVCPRCGGPVGADQAWCLTCGAPARTRVVPTPRWRVPVIVVGAVVVVALGALAGAFVVGTRGGTEPAAPMTEPAAPGQTTPAPAPAAPAPAPTTTAPPAATVPPATAAAPPVVTTTPSTTPTGATTTVPPATVEGTSPSGGDSADEAP